MYKYDIITILGPTASGKTSLSCNLAYNIDSEIISGDSRQVYKSMDIGTGKDLSEYIIENTHIPYYLIDIKEAGYKYNIYEFQHDFFEAYQEIKDKNKLPIFCGGSGLYIESVIKGYNLIDVPENKELRNKLKSENLESLTNILKSYKDLHNHTDIDTAQRAIRAIEIEDYKKNTKNINFNQYPSLNSLTIGIDISRDLRRDRITSRLKERLEGGMIEEVDSILKKGLSPEDLIYYGLEYKYITLFLTNKMSYNNMISELEIAIHQFAKRQMTWFRGMEKRGLTIKWIDGTLPMEEKVSLISKYLE